MLTSELQSQERSLIIDRRARIAKSALLTSNPPIPLVTTCLPDDKLPDDKDMELNSLAGYGDILATNVG